MKIFILGLSSGIGRSLAINLVKDGHEVWGLARGKEALAELENELASPRLKTFVCDLKNPNSIQKTLAQIHAEGFLPDVIILNAAISINDSKKSFNLEASQDMLRVNFESLLVWIAEFLPPFQKRGHGTFIAISSTARFRPGFPSITYPATKAALSSLFRGLRVNFATKNIKFLTIHFGPIKTDMWKGPNFPGLPSSEKAAGFITKTMNKKSGYYYYPRPSTSLTRLVGMLPDSLFQKFHKNF